VQLFRTIRGRLILLALLALAPLLAAFAHVARNVQRVRAEAELTADLELARAAACAFAAFVRDVSRSALPLGESIASGRPTPEEATELLEKTAAAYTAVRELSWVSAAGQVILSSNPRAVNVQVADRDYHLRILAGDDEAVSELLEPRTGEDPSFIIARAIRAPGGRLLGTVLAVIAPERLHESTFNMVRARGAAFSVLDRSGRLVFRWPEAEFAWSERAGAMRQEIVRRALRGEEATGAFVGEAGDERVGAAVPVPGVGWVARASRGTAAPIWREHLRAGAVAILAAVASLGASALFGRRLVRALRALEDHADALGRGEEAPRGPPSRVPELARLAETTARMAERLGASRRALQTAFESAPAGIALLDGETLRGRWANRAWLDLLDEPHRSAGVAGVPIEELLPGAEAFGLVHELRRAAAGAPPHPSSEVRLDRLDRGPSWWRWSVRALPSTDRQGGRDLLVLATDVTEQVTARRRVEEDRRRLEAVLEALPVGVVIADRDGRIVETNEAARAIWGGVLPGSPERIVGWWTDSGAPLRAEDWVLARALSRGETSMGEMVDVQRADGARATVLTGAVPIRGGGGAIVGAVAAIQDMSELRRAQRRERILLDAGAVLAETLELDEAAARLARFAVPLVADYCGIDEVLPDGTLRLVALAHPDPAQEASARAAIARLGAEGGRALVRRAVAERVTVHVADVAAARDVAGGAAEHLAELRRIGVRSWIAVPLVASGTTIGSLTLATADSGRTLDADDARLAEELAGRVAQALENARLFGEVQAAVRARDEVLSVVSHDLRNPLGVVTLGARVIAALPDGPDALERARASGRRIQAAAERMARLIGDLLDLAALREGRLAVERVACAPADLLREAMEESRGAATARGLELASEAEPGLPRVDCDRGRVLQILGNLISNAVKATERGFVRVSAARREGEVEFRVADSGPGISPEEQARLFERFSRGSNAGYPGTGLGLAIARGLVEAHGGRIWVESRPGEGATFRFTLPVLAARRGEDGAQAGGTLGPGEAAAGAR
jgi:PAS domain S-box-containing protein